MVKNGQGWIRLTQIKNDKIEKFKLNSSRRTSCDITPLMRKDWAEAGPNSLLA